MKFAGAQSRLAQPDVSDQCGHDLGLRAATHFGLAALVIRLPADAHVTAGSLDAQLFDSLLREDLPEGFFTAIP